MTIDYLRAFVSSALILLLIGTLPAAAQQPGSRYQGPDPRPEFWPTPTHYISPDGSDDNEGTSPETAWQTFDHAVPHLRPGDVLGVMDGTYTIDTTGMIRVDCGINGSAWNGRYDEPITVRAVNERQALLDSDGETAAVHINRCRNWNVLGLTARGTDKEMEEGDTHRIGNSPSADLVGVHHSKNIALKRILAIHSNRLGVNSNNHLFTIASSNHIMVEESEAYEHHRHAFMAWKSEHVTFRRNYVNPRDHYQWEGFPEDRRQWSDEAIAYYRGSWGIAENNINEGRNVGYHAHGGDTYALQPGGSWNEFLGNIGLHNKHASRIDARIDPFVQARPAIGNVFRNFLVVGVANGLGLWYSSATDGFASNVTIYDGQGTGFRADSRSRPPCEEVAPYGGCTHHLQNALVFENSGVGIENAQQDDWLVEYSNAYNNAGENFEPRDTPGDDRGHIQYSMSVDPTEMGLGAGECIVFVPARSNMKGAGKNGADIGANILYRYRNGRLTDQPLWNARTGAFPHGAVVEGINDRAGDSLFDVHERLNVNTNGCTLPYSR
jgi:hypothetical protein